MCRRDSGTFVLVFQQHVLLYAKVWGRDRDREIEMELGIVSAYISGIAKVFKVLLPRQSG